MLGLLGRFVLLGAAVGSLSVGYSQNLGGALTVEERLASLESQLARLDVEVVEENVAFVLPKELRSAGAGKWAKQRVGDGMIR